jgi:hypothetical protein
MADRSRRSVMDDHACEVGHYMGKPFAGGLACPQGGSAERPRGRGSIGEDGGLGGESVGRHADRQSEGEFQRQGSQIGLGFCVGTGDRQAADLARGGHGTQVALQQGHADFGLRGRQVADSAVEAGDREQRSVEFGR